MKPVPITFEGNVAAYLLLHLEEELGSGELPAVSQDYLERARATLQDALDRPQRPLGAVHQRP
jgi:hypothetical protein